MNKKRLTGNFALPVLSALALLMSSCSQQEDVAAVGSSGPAPLSFAVNSGDGWSTRGVARTELSGAFGILGSEYDYWDESGEAPNMMYNDAATGSDGNFKTSMAYIPERNKTMSFFAYYPYSASITSSSNALYMQTGEEDPGFPYFSYSVPDDVSKQNDLMVAMAHGTFGTNENGEIVKLPVASGSEKAPIELYFYHLLSGVKFKINNDFDRGKITRVALTNLNYKGDFGYGQKDEHGDYIFEWTELNNSSRRACYANLDFQLTGLGEEGGTGTKSNELELTDVNETFLVMPQTLNDGVKIQITYNNGNEDFLLEYPIGKKMKNAGTPITLKRAALTTFYLYVDAIHRLNAKVTVQDWGTGYTFDGGASDEGQIDMEAVIKDWDDLDSKGNSTTTNILTGAQD